jgi:hypothetical protein
MTAPLVIQGSVGTPGGGTAAAAASGRVPRVARLLALALHLDRLVTNGTAAGYGELARLGHVSRARISQVMALLNLAPDLQERVLFLPATPRGRDRVRLRDLLPIAALVDWRAQRRRWREAGLPE